MTRWARAAVAAGVATLLAIPGVPWALGIRRVRAGAEPLVVETAFPYAAWDAVLRRFVAPDGTVDYESLAGDSLDLRRFVATLGDVGPRTRPELFPSPDHALAWNINAYNAVTLLGIIDSWPTRGVHDIHGPLTVRPGFGFFWGLRFRLDGAWTHTYGLENDVIRKTFGDARIHAAINCASASCPRLSDRAYLPERLDAQLDAATREFASSAPHVVLDEDARVVRLSPIFQWFAGDFEADAGGAGSVLEFIERYSDAPEAVARARSEGWPVEYAVYDWSLNAAPGLRPMHPAAPLLP